MNLRHLLTASLFATLFFSAPLYADGKLSLYYDARKESLDVTYRDAQGKLIPAAVQKINYFLRSPDNQTHDIDIGVIDLVNAIQDHFNEPVIEIISGYRSPTYNKGLKDTGHAVAGESLHMQGKAIDIHLDTITEEAVRDYALSLHQGGVGWYPQNDFVHVDVGPVRTWGHPETKRKFVGLENNSGPLFIRTTANNYSKTEKILADISPMPKTSVWLLEKFSRGTWKIQISSNSKTLLNGHLRIPESDLQKLPRGRYRLRISESLSNEFYLKN